MGRYRILFIATAVLILAVLACGSGTYTTRHSVSGNTGHVEISAESANGASTQEIEIDEEYDEEPVELTASVEVQTGTCRVEFLDDSFVVFALEAKAGEPASGSGTVTTDDEGKISLRVTAENAEGVKVVIDYTLR
jgi:hypothetical protein